MSNPSAVNKQDRSGIARVIADYLPLFSLNLCGLVAIRIWIQCNLYDRYISTDSGIITIVSNLVRVALIIIMIAIVIRQGFSAKAQRWVGYASIATMTLASLLFLINTTVGSPQILWVACICAGCGIVWGGGMWICHYVRLHPGEALFYAFVSLGVSSFLGFFLGILPENITYLIAILMPCLALIMYQRAQRTLDERENQERSFGEQENQSLTSSGGLKDKGKDAVYDNEPKSTFIRLTIGIALFNIALGIARGFPSGESIALPVAFQAIHQCMVLLLSFGLIWWALGKRRIIKFSTLWNISVVLIALGVLVLAATDAALNPLGATLIAISNTFAVGLLWFSCYDVARHSSIPAYIILGVAWAAHILPREIGRAGIWLLGPNTTEATMITALIVVLLALSMGFLLNDSIPSIRHLFAEFRAKDRGELFRDKVVAHANLGTEEESIPLPDAALSADHDQGVNPSVRTLEKSLALLGERYFLTQRELEVVQLLAQGRSRVAIGQKLYISENTVRTYVKNIYAKLDIHSKQELIDRLEELQA